MSKRSCRRRIRICADPTRQRHWQFHQDRAPLYRAHPLQSPRRQCSSLASRYVGGNGRRGLHTRQRRSDRTRQSSRSPFDPSKDMVERTLTKLPEHPGLGRARPQAPPAPSFPDPRHASVLILNYRARTHAAVTCSRAARARLILARISAPSAFQTYGFGSALRWKVGRDVTDQLVDRGEATRADLHHLSIGEEALDQIEPGRRGRGEMHLEARVFFQPPPHLGVFVRGVVVGDQMQLEGARRLAIDLLEKTQPF